MLLEKKKQIRFQGDAGGNCLYLLWNDVLRHGQKAAIRCIVLRSGTHTFFVIRCWALFTFGDNVTRLTTFGDHSHNNVKLNWAVMGTCLSPGEVAHLSWSSWRHRTTASNYSLATDFRIITQASDRTPWLEDQLTEERDNTLRQRSLSRKADITATLYSVKLRTMNGTGLDWLQYGSISAL